MFSENFSTVQDAAKNQAAHVQSVTSELVGATEKLKKGLMIDVDLDNAKLDQVKSTQDLLNQNIVTCIMDLDSTANRFGSEFNSMRTHTGFEKFISFFSKNTSEEMRSDRIKKADISDNLQNLISQSNQIVVILTESEQVVKKEIEKGNVNLEEIVRLREEVVTNHQDLKGKVDSLIEQITRLEGDIANELDPEKRTKLETELVGLNRSYNETLREEQVLLAQSQTLENYVQKNELHLESLNKTLSAQQVLINKIKTDTAQRVVLYEQYQQTLKVSMQQQIAHKINEIGSDVDNAVMEGMAQAGHAAANQVMDMFESHNDIMRANAELNEKSRKATEKFVQRFQTQIQKHNSGIY